MNRRLIVGPCRSGTTMLLRSAKNNPDALVEFQTIKAGQRARDVPDHSFFTRDVPAGKTLVNKETVGYGNSADCTLEIFPDDEAIRASRPAYIFREPRQTFASWLEHNLAVPDGDAELFIRAYRHTYLLLQRSLDASPHALVMTYDAVCADARGKILKLCAAWDMPFHPDMVDWKDAFIDSTPLDKAGVNEGHYAAVSAQSGIGAAKMRGEIPELQTRQIEDALGEIYRIISTLEV